MVSCRDVNNVEAMGGAMADIERSRNMKVKFNGKEYDARDIGGGLYALSDGSIASQLDCKPVENKAQKADKAEPKPNKAKKKKAE